MTLMQIHYLYIFIDQYDFKSYISILFQSHTVLLIHHVIVFGIPLLLSRQKSLSILNRGSGERQSEGRGEEGGREAGGDRQT